MVFPFFNPLKIVGSNKFASPNFNDSFNPLSGNFNDDHRQFTTTNNFSDDDVTNVTNIIGSSVSGSDVGGQTTLLRKTTTQEVTPTLTDEKPISFAPALFGGGTNTATGEATAGGNPTAIAGVIGGVVLVGGLGYILIKSKGKK